MSDRPPAPLGSRWLLGLLVGREERRTLHSELAELYEVHRRRYGDAAAAGWYRRQLRRYVAHLTAARVQTIPGPIEAMNILLRESLHTVRRLGRTPLFTATVLLTLALAIGANVAVFAVVNAVLLEPLPFESPERLVGLWHRWPGQVPFPANMSPALYLTYRDSGRAFEDVGMWDGAQITITGTGEPERVEAMLVTDGTLPILRVSTLHGRLFAPADDAPGAPLTAIVSHAYWRDRLEADPGRIGEILVVNGRPAEIIGVLRPGLRFLDRDPAVYLPFRWNPAEVHVGNFSFQGLGRLADGFSIADANADIDRMIPLATERFPGLSLETLNEGGFRALVRPLCVDVVGDIGDVLWVLVGTVGIVLLIACANIANLMLVRAETRQTELAIRAALGAGRGQLARAWLLESVGLALAGGLLGTGIATLTLRALVDAAPQGLPRRTEIAIGAEATLIAVMLSLLAGCMFGAIPLRRFGAMALATTLKEGSRGGGDTRYRHRVRDTLVVAQMALALVLLVASGLMVRSFIALRDVQPGFAAPEQLTTFRVAIPAVKIPEPEELLRAHEVIMRRVAALPGVDSVALTSSVTMDGWDSNDSTEVEGFPMPPNVLPPSRRYKWISPEYFATMGNPVIAGRTFTWQEVHDAEPLGVITENFALEYWSSPAEAIGKRIREGDTAPWRTIVGVVGDVHDEGVDQPATTVAFWPLMSRDFWGQERLVRNMQVYVVRSARVGSPSLMAEVRAAVWERDPNLPLANVWTMNEILNRSTARTSFTLVMLAIAAATAVLLGAIGIYGVTSYVVAQRTREIGVRMALGARRIDVSRLVLRHGLRLGLVGTAAGLLAAAGLTRLLGALLFGVSPIDPFTYAIGTLGVTGLVLVASYVPARHAAGVDPNEALRWE